MREYIFRHHSDNSDSVSPLSQPKFYHRRGVFGEGLMVNTKSSVGGVTCKCPRTLTWPLSRCCATSGRGSSSGTADLAPRGLKQMNSDHVEDRQGIATKIHSSHRQVVAWSSCQFGLTKVDVRVGHECEVLVATTGARGHHFGAEAVAAVPAESEGLTLVGREADAVPLAVGRCGEGRLRQRGYRIAEGNLKGGRH